MKIVSFNPASIDKTNDWASKERAEKNMRKEEAKRDCIQRLLAIACWKPSRKSQKFACRRLLTFIDISHMLSMLTTTNNKTFPLTNYASCSFFRFFSFYFVDQHFDGICELMLFFLSFFSSHFYFPSYSHLINRASVDIFCLRSNKSSTILCLSLCRIIYVLKLQIKEKFTLAFNLAEY